MQMTFVLYRIFRELLRSKEIALELPAMSTLTLNSTKTEAVVFAKDSHEVQVMNMAGQHLNTQSCTKMSWSMTRA